MKDDMISRQAAINSPFKMVSDGLEWVPTYHLMELPSAQLAQDLPNGCTDTISRVAAIDAMMKLQTEDIEAYGASIPEGFDGDRAATALKVLPSAQPGWIPCSTALPKTEEKVLITCERLDIYGKPHRYVCKAFHVDRYTMRSDVDWWDEGCDEYREEDDQYYVLEGWYEYIHNWGDYSSVRITEDRVVAWCELPTPYREGGQDGKN